MSIVSNASPLISLARIGRLNLLQQLYGELIIPEAVWNEIVIEGSGKPGADEVKEAPWIKKQAIKNKQLAHVLRQERDAGESEAIALALESEAELLLMDERLGRQTANYLGIHCIGLIGVLIEAKRKGFIEQVKPLLDALQNLAGFRISPSLYSRILQDEKEIEG